MSAAMYSRQITFEVPPTGDERTTLEKDIASQAQVLGARLVSVEWTSDVDLTYTIVETEVMSDNPAPIGIDLKSVADGLEIKGQVHRPLDDPSKPPGRPK